MSFPAGAGDTVRVLTRGFVSQYGGAADDDWPTAWAIVDVRPERWMGTIPLLGLGRVVGSDRTDLPLHGIGYRWESGRLVLELGPAHVVGDPTQWRAWARRLIDRADSAAELLESPRAYEWSGPVTLVEVDAVEVVDR